MVLLRALTASISRGAVNHQLSLFGFKKKENERAVGNKEVVAWALICGFSPDGSSPNIRSKDIRRKAWHVYDQATCEAIRFLGRSPLPITVLTSFLDNSSTIFIA